MKFDRHMKHRVAVLVAAAFLFPNQVTQAEGTDQLNATQALRASMVLHVDIVDSGIERIVWTGVGSVDAVAPDGTALGSFASGATISPTNGNGTYSLSVLSDQIVGTRWDVSVVDQTTTGGRLFSYDWAFNAGAFSEERATFGSFFATVPGGEPGDTAVIELQLSGLAGYVYNINANRVGVDGPNGGRSVPQTQNSVTPKFKMYLSPPTLASYSRVTPSISGLIFAGGTDESVLGEAITPCTDIVPGQSIGRFVFNTDAEGSFHLQCDLDGDGAFSKSSGSDLLLIGSTNPGENVVEWNGLNNGQPVPEGQYQCRVQINIGEFHYVGRDIETSYPGMRLFEVLPDFSKESLTMFWNDTLVQSNALAMQNGEVGLESSGEGGIDSGAYGTDTIANVNARSWGAFVSTGKGNQAYLDTFVWLDSVTSSLVTLGAVSGEGDRDSDGLSDFDEECTVGSDADNPDSDGDGVIDGDQYVVPTSGQNGGLESNGRLAPALARRAIRRTRESPIVVRKNVSRIAALIPHEAIVGDYSVDVSPTDLVEITNATDVYSVDYLDSSGVLRGSVLAIETQGEHYEHSKAVCDRADGAMVTSLSSEYLLDFELARAEYVNSNSSSRDVGISFALYIDERTGRATRLESFWLQDRYTSVTASERAVSFQVWAGKHKDLAVLVKRIIDGILTHYPELHEVNDGVEVDEESDENKRMETTTLPIAPNAFIAWGRTLGGEIKLDLRYNSGARDAVIRVTSLDQDNRSESVREFAVRMDDLQTPLTVQSELFLDATVELVRDGVVEDRVWLSDGAWAPFDDSLWGGSTVLSRFERMDCKGEDNNTLANGDVELSGCGAVDATVSQSNGYAGVARHISTPIALNTWSEMSFYLRSERSTQVCIDVLDSNERGCVSVGANATDARVSIPMEDFGISDTALGKVQKPIFVWTDNAKGSVAIEVSNLVLRAHRTAAMPDTSSGCAITVTSRKQGSALWASVVLAILCVTWQRRATVRHMGQ